MERVPIEDLRVQRAAAFVRTQISRAIGERPAAYLRRKVDDRTPWIVYSPAETGEDKAEREALVARYGKAAPDSPDHYLWYHGCVDVAVFFWAAHAAAGTPTPVAPEILVQRQPHPHTYLRLGTGRVLDPLYERCGVSYPYAPEVARRYATPRELYEDCGPKWGLSRSELAEALARLKELEC